MDDLLYRALKINDTVGMLEPGLRCIVIGNIIRFTKKKITVRYTNMFGHVKITSKHGRDLVKINDFPIGIVGRKVRFRDILGQHLSRGDFLLSCSPVGNAQIVYGKITKFSKDFFTVRYHDYWETEVYADGHLKISSEEITRLKLVQD